MGCGIDPRKIRHRRGGLANPYSFLSSHYRWLSLSPTRASPPATTIAIQLTDFGTDQSPMMRLHSSKIRTKWNRATTAKISPATRENVFCSMANQLNRGRTLVGVATRSSSFVAIKYANELPNWTTIQFGVLLDVASTAPSSWVALRRILSPTLMLMLLSFRSPKSAWRNGVAAVRPFLPSSWIKSVNALTDRYRPAILASRP